nr:putative glutathione-dependent formaldehyde-activating enzyme [Quercus suber]
MAASIAIRPDCVHRALIPTPHDDDGKDKGKFRDSRWSFSPRHNHQSHTRTPSQPNPNMPAGGCFCGKVRIEYTGEIQAKALCHCEDCKKITGSTYSTNIIVPGDGFSVTSGTPKTFSKQADSGNSITSHFCGDCGSTLFREGATFGPSKVIKVGIMDDVSALADAKPAVELFAPERVGWVSKVQGADQLKTMPGSEAVA